MSGRVAAALEAVAGRVQEAARVAGRRDAVRLVAVSKLKPVAAVMEAYEAGHRHFGENYVQELVSKAPEAPEDVRWHFIGQLQSNKCKRLVEGVPGLWMVESVDSAKLANKLDAACASVAREAPLQVLVQVNTSAEAQKGGVAPGDAAALATHIRDHCPRLVVRGLMTIGKLGHPAREYFVTLAHTREAVAAALGCAPDSLELSMGMSADFEMAIECGSTNVRVGSTIFGARPPKPAVGDAAPDGAGDDAGSAAAGGAAAAEA